jgi:hypothetical protein
MGDFGRAVLVAPYDFGADEAAALTEYCGPRELWWWVVPITFWAPTTVTVALTGGKRR